MEKLSRADLKHNLAIIKINRSYKEGMSTLELYDVTRGCWKRRLESVRAVEYVLAVAYGVVKEVYKVDRWVPADELSRETIPFDAEKEKGRVGFFGAVADDEIRNLYIEKSVADFYKQGEAGSVKVFLKTERILYCRVGWMNAYRGNATERPQGGGKYNIDNVGHEVYNYLGYEGRYYGFVEPGLHNGTTKNIAVEKLCGERKADSAENVLVVWLSTKPGQGQYIVGWYEDATVFNGLRKVPQDAMSVRTLKDHDFYNIYAEQVFLVEPDKRTFRVEGMGHSGVWYGNPEVNAKVFDYIKDYSNDYEERIENVERDLDSVVGDERDAIVKVRVNQDRFREGLLKKYHSKCCLCGVDDRSLLVASHIKPWAKSDEHEKLDLANGLLLCPNHDKLFDGGYISFDEDGEIIISDKISSNSKIFMNVHADMKIEVTEDNADYIRYHRNNIFR